MTTLHVSYKIMNLLKLIPLISVFLICGCANIEHGSKTSQPTNKSLRAGVGDVIIKIKHERNLENAFGKSDIFGRKTTEGYSELRYAGKETNGVLVFYRTDVSILTNETTMSRTPVSNTFSNSNTTASGQYYGNQFSGRANTTTHSTTINPAEDYHIPIPRSAIPIRLNDGEKEIVMADYLIRILRAESAFVEYTIIK